MEQIDPNDLLVFARVVAEGSLTAAADKLGLPKSTVSRRLSRLEELLGERLLLRTTRRLNITEFGAALLDHARQLESEVEAVAALAESRQARPSGRLRVSMPSDFANLLLTDMLAAFAALHPAVTLELDLSPRRVDLLGENFDLAIRLGDLPDDADRQFPVALRDMAGRVVEVVDGQRPYDLAERHAQMNLQTLPGKNSGGLPGDILIGHGQEFRQHFEEGHLCSQTTPDTAHFQTNYPGPDDQELFRHAVDIECADVVADQAVIDRHPRQMART